MFILVKNTNMYTQIEQRRVYIGRMSFVLLPFVFRTI